MAQAPASSAWRAACMAKSIAYSAKEELYSSSYRAAELSARGGGQFSGSQRIGDLADLMRAAWRRRSASGMGALPPSPRAFARRHPALGARHLRGCGFGCLPASWASTSRQLPASMSCSIFQHPFRLPSRIFTPTIQNTLTLSQACDKSRSVVFLHSRLSCRKSFNPSIFPAGARRTARRIGVHAGCHHPVGYRARSRRCAESSSVQLRIRPTTALRW